MTINSFTTKTLVVSFYDSYTTYLAETMRLN